MLKQSFRDFIFSTNTDGNGKASSCVRALDMLGPILTWHHPYTVINGTMWQRFSLAGIHEVEAQFTVNSSRKAKDEEC